MSDTLNFTEIDTQHIELLPGRTLMSVFRTAGSATTPGATGGGSTTGGGGGPLDSLTKMNAQDIFAWLLGFGKGK
jgi:hypothetical protein